MTKFKVGDKLTFEIGEVVHLKPDRVTIRFRGAVSTNLIDISAIQHHESVPEPLKVGDKVRCATHPAISVGKIIAIYGDDMWLRFDSIGDQFRKVADYDRVE